MRSSFCFSSLRLPRDFLNIVWEVQFFYCFPIITWEPCQCGVEVWGKGALHSPISRFRYLWAYALGCDLHTCSSAPPGWGKKGKGARVSITSPRLVRLWWNNFSWGQALLRKTDALAYSQWGHLPTPLLKQEGFFFFLSSSVWKPGMTPGCKPHKSVPPPEFLTLNFSTLSLQHLLIIVQLFLPQH